MQIMLVDTNAAIINAWAKVFGAQCDTEEHPVSLHHRSVFDVPARAYVSPANSFGFMNGGIDAAYLERWPNAEREVRLRIQRRHYGEIPVGNALAVALPMGGFHSAVYLIVAPTMRVPMRLPPCTVNPYLATKAALFEASTMHVSSVVLPGMGTGVGGVSPEVCAKQMRAAYDEFCLVDNDETSRWVDCVSAIEAHRDLSGQGGEAFVSKSVEKRLRVQNGGDVQL